VILKSFVFTLTIFCGQGLTPQEHSRDLPGIVVSSQQKPKTKLPDSLLADDLLLEWSLVGKGQVVQQKGTFEDPFVFKNFLEVWAIRPSISVKGLRDGKSFVCNLDPGDWSWEWYPSFPANLSGDYENGLGLLLENKFPEGLSVWANLVDRLVKDGHLSLATWVSGKLGRFSQTAGDWDSAISWYEKAKEFAELGSNEQALAQTYLAIGMLHYRRRELSEARPLIEQAIAKLDSLQGSEVFSLSIHNNLAIMYFFAGEVQRAIEINEAALQKLQVIVPMSPPVMRISSNLGLFQKELQNFDAARTHFLRDLEICKRYFPRSQSLIDSYSNLGNFERAQGRYLEAENYYRETLALIDEVGEDVDKAAVLNGLGLMYSSLGKYQKAENTLFECLRVVERK